MSLLKTNEIQNYNGSSLTLTASTVSTSAQLNTGGNISVTGSLNVSDDSTTRTNLGLGSMATQNANAVAITGGSISGVQLPNFVGLILPFAYDTSGSPPSGFLECKGAAVSRTTYSDLFAAIGTTWGVGDGSTTFNLPDLQGAFLRGTGTGSINSRNKVGPSVGSFQEDQFQGHGHNIRYDNVGSGEEIIDSVSGDNSGLNVIEVKQPAGDAGYFEADSNGTPRHGSETRPYNAGVMYCIKY